MFQRNRRLVLIIALVLASAGTFSFAIRAVQYARHLHARTDEPIQPWMNVPYIAHAYHVRPEVIHQALGLPQGQRDRRPIRRIAETQGRSVDALIADLMAAIQRDRESRPPGRGEPGASPPAQGRLP
jgi:hypothetical protein